jgi:hypothetical protein
MLSIAWNGFHSGQEWQRSTVEFDPEKHIQKFSRGVPVMIEIGD